MRCATHGSPLAGSWSAHALNAQLGTAEFTWKLAAGAAMLLTMATGRQLLRDPWRPLAPRKSERKNGSCVWLKKRWKAPRLWLESARVRSSSRAFTYSERSTKALPKEPKL